MTTTKSVSFEDLEDLENSEDLFDIELEIIPIEVNEEEELSEEEYEKLVQDYLDHTETRRNKNV